MNIPNLVKVYIFSLREFFFPPLNNHWCRQVPKSSVLTVWRISQVSSCQRPRSGRSAQRCCSHITGARVIGPNGSPGAWSFSPFRHSLVQYPITFMGNAWSRWMTRCSRRLLSLTFVDPKTSTTSQSKQKRNESFQNIQSKPVIQPSLLIHDPLNVR